MKLRRIISFLILGGVLFLPLLVQAQSPSPSPAPSPVRSLSDNIAALSQRAGSRVSYINNDIVPRLIGWFELQAGVVENYLPGYALLRAMREDSGEGPT